MPTPKVSVIIPVYNTAPYLRRCLDSVCGQTLRDIEVICVNDASTDNSLDILNEYAVKDRRIKVIDFPENKGVSAARNAGIDAACGGGEYIGFVDSDDTIDVGFYEKLYRAAIETNPDVAQAPIRVVFDKTKSVTHDKWYWFYSSICKHAFLKINNIIFPEGISTCEDVLFSVRIFLFSKKRIEVTDVYYNYYQVPGSCTHSITDEKIESIIETFDIIFHEIKTSILMSVKQKVEYDSIILNVFKCFLNIVKFKFTDNVKYYAAEKTIAWYDEFIRHESSIDKKLEIDDPVLYKMLISKNIDELTAYFLNGRQNLAKILRKKLGINRLVQ
jgi:glycosyltransferase involved in cell wall biosynthesis